LLSEYFPPASGGAAQVAIEEREARRQPDATAAPCSPAADTAASSAS